MFAVCLRRLRLLGIGVNALRTGLLLGTGAAVATAAFGLAYGILDRPLPYRSPPELVLLVQELTTSGSIVRLEQASSNELRFWREQRDIFLNVAGYATATLVSRTDEGPDARLRLGRYTADLPGVLDLKPLLGRDFSDLAPSERSSAIVVSESYWRTHYGGGIAVLGSVIGVAGGNRSVVGVMPSEFRFLVDADAWILLEEEDGAAIARLRTSSIAGSGKLIQERGREITADRRRSWAAQPLQEVREGRVPQRVRLTVYSVAALIVLITIVSAAGLGFQGAGSHVDRLTVMTALGADRVALLRVVLAQGVAPILVALPTTIWLSGFVSAGLESWIPQDIRWFLFLSSSPAADMSTPTIAVAAVTACWLLSMAAPIATTWRLGVGESGGLLAPRRHGARLQLHSAAIVIKAIQIVLATLLVGAATVLVGNYHQLSNTSWGFVPDGLNYMTVSLSTATMPDRLSRRGALDRLLAELRVTASQAVAEGDRPTGRLSARIRKDGADLGQVRLAVFGRSYFQLAGIELLEGRLPAPEDGGICQVVASDAAGLLLGGATAALGSQISIGGWPGDMQVVAIAKGIRQPTSRHDVPVVFLPEHCDAALRSASILVRDFDLADPGRQSSLKNAIQRSGLRWVRFGSAEQDIAQDLIVPRFYARTATLVAALAVVLSFLSIYAVAVEKVAQSKNVVRMWYVLGASWPIVMLEAIRRESRPIFTGMLAGLLVLFASERVIGPGPREASIGTPEYLIVVAVVIMLSGVGAAVGAYAKEWRATCRRWSA